MIKILFGEDRGKLGEKIKAELGEDYEVFEGENLEKTDLPGIFFGETLFSSGARRILIKELGENKEVFGEFCEKIEEFVKTEAKVVLAEMKVDKRLSGVKKVAKAGVEILEFKKAETFDSRAVFGIFDLALRDGEGAVRELKKIEEKQDPYMFFGLMVSQALKKLEWRPNGAREKRIVRELSRVDMEMKSTGVEPWVLVEGFLLRMKGI
ncbi:hypothetical protein IKG02_01150 [Candidatus Saccharibacteria bacterium]|nr:hypothetical protein [Candidatus Saccharibacteria bacterium]